MRAAALAIVGLVLAPLPLASQGAPVVTSLTLFAGTPSALWRSSDWGATWSRARPGATHAILPTGPRVLLGSELGLAVSEDFGQTWKDTSLQATVLSVLPSRYPQSDPTLFVGTPAGLLRSEDAGRTFGPPTLAPAPVRRIEWPGPDLVVSAGTAVLVSADGGKSFREPGQGLPGAEVTALALSSFYAVDPVLFVAAEGKGVFRSSDGARTWTPAGLERHTVHDLVWLGPFLYAAADDGLYRTEDLGAHWTGLGEGISGRAALRLLFPLAPASGAEAFLGTDRGIYHTLDGGAHWQPAGLAEERVLTLATFPPPAPALARPRKR